MLSKIFSIPMLRTIPKSLLFKVLRNRKRVPSATGLTEQLAIIQAIYKAPAGAVVECGTYLGGSAVNLSLACRDTNRLLYIFDSFEGLPEPSQADRNHLVPSSSEVHRYAKGYWKGPLETVRANLRKFGYAEVCHFNKGYFEETLPKFEAPVAVAFCDVDLVDSLRTCLKYIWPMIVEGGYLFTHEAHHLSIAKLFYDDAWWNGAFGCEAPGLIGAGSGLGLTLTPQGTFGSCLGYVIKTPKYSAVLEEVGLPS
jgi:O-methyltransferase